MAKDKEEIRKQLLDAALGQGEAPERRTRIVEAFSADPGFSEDSLIAYVAGQSSPLEREIVEAAMEIDPGIRAQVDAMLEAKAEMQLRPQVAVRNPEPERQRAPWWPWGGWATAGAAAVVAGIVILSPRPSTDQTELVQLTSRLNAVESQNADLLARATNAETTLESLKSAGVPSGPDTVRSGAGRPGTQSEPRVGVTGPSKPTVRSGGPDSVASLGNGENVLKDGDTTLVETPNGLASVELIPDPVVAIQIDEASVSPRKVDKPRGAITWPLRTGNTQSPAVEFELHSPAHSSVRATKPTFRFSKVEGAEGYILRVYLEERKVAEVKGESNELTLEADLPRGESYRWTVTAISADGREVTQSNAGDFAAAFRVLSDMEIDMLEDRLNRAGKSKIEQLKVLTSFGLADEALEVAKSLREENPKSELARRILESLQDQMKKFREKR